ncbi:755_t:CDS:2 [Cetraspora pellucida]|uniref:755_t:CDS:1 n=1 Tax=Cetraspora pellucida TaxID=1433469 RepID=A0ACA9L171_9GLOM|nr:755_t:CDS:2 [Cetraspora pellucida]
MPRQKINTGPCSIYNCDKNQDNFQCLTQLAMKKAFDKKTIQRYPYLRVGQQVCNSHYMIIVKNGYTEHKSASVPNSSTKLSFGDRIKKMTSVLYKNRQNGLVRELIDEQNDTDETDLDEKDDSQLEIDRDLELDLQNKISEMNSW